MRSSDWSSDVCASDLFRHRNSERVEAAGVGRIAAGHATSAETAGTHLAAHVALASAVRHALPRPTGALRRAGPAVPGLREPPPRLSGRRSEEHTSELQSLMRISYAVFCLKKKTHSQLHSIQII